MISPLKPTEFGLAASLTIDRGLVLELLKCEFLSRKENILLNDGRGTGKAHLAMSIAFEGCGQGTRVRFAPVTVPWETRPRCRSGFRRARHRT